MPLVTLDTNLIDVFVEVQELSYAAEALEAQRPPPRSLQDDWRAAWWVLMLADAWSGVTFTFSEQLLDELASMPPAKVGWASWCIGFALDVRVGHSDELLQPDRSRRPPAELVESWGLSRKDATHVADAIGFGADYFLTRDQDLLKKARGPAAAFGIRVRTLHNFVREAYQLGAPFPRSLSLDDL